MSRQPLTTWRPDGTAGMQTPLQQAGKPLPGPQLLLLTAPRAILSLHQRLRAPQNTLEQNKDPHKQQLSRLQPPPAVPRKETKQRVSMPLYSSHVPALANILQSGTLTQSSEIQSPTSRAHAGTSRRIGMAPKDGTALSSKLHAMRTGGVAGDADSAVGLEGDRDRRTEAPRRAARDCPLGPPLKGRVWLKHQTTGECLSLYVFHHHWSRPLVNVMLFALTSLPPHAPSSTYRRLPR